MPRPVTPVYTQLSEILQVQLHRALTRQTEPATALSTAARADAGVCSIAPDWGREVALPRGEPGYGIERSEAALAWWMVARRRSWRFSWSRSFLWPGRSGSRCISTISGCPGSAGRSSVSPTTSRRSAIPASGPRWPTPACLRGRERHPRAAARHRARARDESRIPRPRTGARGGAGAVGDADRSVGACSGDSCSTVSRNRQRRAGQGWACSISRSSGSSRPAARLGAGDAGRRVEDDAVRRAAAARRTPEHRRSLYEAARIDGASAWRQFRYVTLPLLKPAMLVALIFRTLDAFRVFDLIYVMTGGGPGTSTEPIALYTFNALLQNLRFGYGSALSVIVFFVTFGLALRLHQVPRRRLTETKRDRRAGGTARWAALAVLMLVLATAFPFYWAIVSSFTPEARLFRSPSLVPSQLVLDHYRALFAERELLGPDPELADRGRDDDRVLRDRRRALRVRARPAPVPGQGAAARFHPRRRACFPRSRSSRRCTCCCARST